jgi:antitoxin component HigA of HigAB toxin-antitoxin module
MQTITENKIEKAIKGKLPTGAGINTDELAKEVGIKPKRLARVVNGTATKLLVTEIKAIAEHFNIPINELV